MIQSWDKLEIVRIDFKKTRTFYIWASRITHSLRFVIIQRWFLHNFLIDSGPLFCLDDGWGEGLLLIVIVYSSSSIRCLLLFIIPHPGTLYNISISVCADRLLEGRRIKLICRLTLLLHHLTVCSLITRFRPILHYNYDYPTAQRPIDYIVIILLVVLIILFTYFSQRNIINPWDLAF